VKSSVLAAAAVLFAWSGPSPAAEARMDGLRLLSYCEHAEKDDAQTSNPFRAGQCLGFVTGTLKGWEAAAAVRNARPNYCIRHGVTVDRIMRAVTQYVRADTARHQAQAEMLVISAVQRAFPCAPGELKK
jgi:hypothetical protein